MSVSIIVPVYPFAKGVTDMAVEALGLFRHSDAEVVVVQNGGMASAQPQLEALADVFVRLAPNQGWSPAVNAGIEAAGGDILVVGSHDAIVGPGWLPPLLAALDHGVGIASPVYPEQPRTSYTGVLFAMPRSVWDLVGPMDTGAFRVRKGDQDFAIRAHLAGVRIEAVPEVVFEHRVTGPLTRDKLPAAVARETEAMLGQYGARTYRRWRKLQKRR